MGTVTYQWLRDGVDIAGETGSTYVLTADDVGSTFTVAVGYTDGQGFDETIESDATVSVIATDSGDATVTITGDAEEGATLTATFADDDPDGLAEVGTVTYQWLRDGADIAGETGSTYVLTADDVGSTFTVAVGYTDGQGFVESIESDPTAAVSAVDSGDATVSISGTAEEGATLTATFADDDPDGLAEVGTVTYQWLRDGADIAGETGSTYVLTADDVGSTFTVAVGYTDGQGFVESIESDPTAAVSAVDSGDATVSISGTAEEGATLTATFADDDPDGLAEVGTVTYQWLRDGADIAGETGSTYVLTADDVGSTFTVAVGYTDGQGFVESITSDPTDVITIVTDSGDATVSISGTAEEGATLTATFADDDPDGLAEVGTVTYQWLRDGADIAGETGSTYVLTADDVGSTFTVAVGYTDGQGFVESITSDPTDVITIVTDSGDATVSISGTAEEGATLTATFADDDPDGLAEVGTVTYQWLRDGADIAGETGSTYVLTADDVGSTFTVAVGYTDGQGFVESIESDPTAAVSAVDSGDATVSISGTAEEGATLTATFADDDPDGLAEVGTVTYQWLRDGADIAGETGSTYVLTADDVGSTFTVAVGYTDGQGFDETIESDATDTVMGTTEDTTPPLALSASFTQAGENDSVTVIFNEDMKMFDTSGLTLVLKGQATTMEMTGFTVDGNSITISTSTGLGAGDYLMIGYNGEGSIEDLAGNPLNNGYIVVDGSGNNTVDMSWFEMNDGWPVYIVGNDGDDIITGTNGQDMIQGNEGADTINGSWGQDIISLLEGTPATDTVVLEAGKSGASSYDVIYRFNVSGESGLDVLNLPSDNIAAATGAFQYGAAIGGIAQYNIAEGGVLTFADSSGAEVAITSANLNDALAFLRATITNPGETVLFEADMDVDGTADCSFVFQDNGGWDIVTQLVGVTGVGLQAGGSSNGVIGLQDTTGPELVGVGVLHGFSCTQLFGERKS